MEPEFRHRKATLFDKAFVQGLKVVAIYLAIFGGALGIIWAVTQ